MNITNHFKRQVDDRAFDLPELEPFSYQELADPLLTSCWEGTLENGDTYREAVLAGVRYGVGYAIDPGGEKS